MTDNLGGYTREALLEQVREYVRLNPPTQADRDEHAISFVLGNLNASANHQTTRDKVEAQYYKLRREEALQRIAEFEAQEARLRIAVDQMESAYKLASANRDELKRTLDAIAEALGQPKEQRDVPCKTPGCNYAMIPLEEDDRYYICTECRNLHEAPKEYQPDQLAGMVRELREQLENWRNKALDIDTQRIQAGLLTDARIDALQREVAALRGALQKIAGYGNTKLGETCEESFKIVSDIADEALAARANSGDAPRPNDQPPD